MRHKRISQKVRWIVSNRVHGRCEYCRCQEEFSPVMYSVEHVVPKSKGGTDELNNLALSCQECNNHKSDKTESADPRTGIMTLLFHPRRDEWKEHFVWQDGYTRISGITPCGRVTVEVLHLNRPNVVNWRGVMYRADLHPLEDLTN